MEINQNQLQTFWQAVLDHVAPPTKPLVKDHISLVKLSDSIAHLQVRNQNLIPFAKKRRKELEQALSEVLGQKTIVEFHVKETNQSTMSNNYDFDRNKLEGIYNHSHPIKPELPPALEKAIQNEHFYWLRLSTGEAIYFSKAELVGNDWVHLIMRDHDHRMNNYPFIHGVDVRLSAIVLIE